MIIPVTPGATDLQISGSASTGSPVRGAAFNYNFLVKNAGNFATNNASFSALIGGGIVTAASVGASACTITPNANGSTNINCSLGIIACGQQVQVTITDVAPNAPATWGEGATVSMDNTDTQPANNSVAGIFVQVK